MPVSTTYPTAVRIEPGIDARLPAPVLLALYATLWAGFTLGGASTALVLADAIGGVAGGVLFLTVGLVLVAAGPTLARQAIVALLVRIE